MPPRMVQEGRGEVPEDAHAEALRVVKALADLIAGSGRSIRDVEAAIGWSQGVLNGALDYRTPLTYSRLFAVLTEIGVEPARFFAALYSPEVGPGDAVRPETVQEFLDGLTGPSRRTLQRYVDQRIEEKLVEPLAEVLRRLRGEP